MFLSFLWKHFLSKLLILHFRRRYLASKLLPSFSHPKIKTNITKPYYLKLNWKYREIYFLYKNVLTSLKLVWVRFDNLKCCHNFILGFFKVNSLVAITHSFFINELDCSGSLSLSLCLSLCLVFVSLFLSLSFPVLVEMIQSNLDIRWWERWIMV